MKNESRIRLVPVFVSGMTLRAHALEKISKKVNIALTPVSPHNVKGSDSDILVVVLGIKFCELFSRSYFREDVVREYRVYASKIKKDSLLQFLLRFCTSILV